MKYDALSGNYGEFQIIEDRNAGNRATTYWKPKVKNGRNFCVQIGEDFLRDKAGRVRRFGSAELARAALAQQKEGGK